MPALERTVQHASSEPRAHAEALVRYAAAIADPMDRAALFVEAARQFRVAGGCGRTIPPVVFAQTR